MAHKTKVGGTGYEITGGRTLVGGTGYSISKGRTLVGGTGYDVAFHIKLKDLPVGTMSTIAMLFVNGLVWSILMDVEQEQEDGSIVTVQEEYDNREYSMAGSITDNRDGTLAVKMGKPTQIETLESQITGTITEAELNNAYVEGVNSL